ncbi:MAG: SCO family protein [Nitrosomonas sp.]|nr:SCO family protein [Nitrosomonas sp.]
MKSKSDLIAINICLFLFLITQCVLIQAQTPKHDSHALHKQMSGGEALDAHVTKITLPNVQLRDSHDIEHDLQVLMQDKIVIMDFVFTSCTTICPVLSAIMSNTEKRIESRLGKEIILISISVDPANDTPDELSDYAKKFEAGSNWYWLTGSPGNINRTLRAFGIPVGGQPEDHPPIILVGNKSKNRWYRWVGVPGPDTLINAVNSFSDAS